MRRPNSSSLQRLAPLFILVLALGCLEGGSPRSYGVTGGKLLAPQQQGKLPRYEDFPVPKVFKGKPAQPLISGNPQARTFRTRLREGALKGPNFAGHYTIVTWGCGTACQQLSIIDAQTGRVYFPKALSTLTYNLVENMDEAGIKYRLNSKLLVLVGSPGEAAESENMVGTFYYKWENNDLKLIHSIKKQR
jgi:hypothetical protein